MSALSLRWTGLLAALGPADLTALLDRSTSSDPDVRATVAEVIADVRRRGDAALRELALRWDRVSLDRLEVPRSACERALAATPRPLRVTLERAAANLRVVHTASRPVASQVEVEAGVVVGRRPDPLERVGLYAPGGRAAYPSSVLMGAVPARVAGVGEIVLCSPPGADGLPPPAVLAAAALAGVDRVFAVGGAGAIAALAWGTASVPRVDRIVGPGNAWVAEAKLQVAGAVGIDAPAGPSEIVVLAGPGADPAFVAREMIAQAEHDPRACAVALAFGAGATSLAACITSVLTAAIAGAPRRDVIVAALAARGGVLAAPDADSALEFANRYAPEHLVLADEAAARLLARVRHAGTVFVGGASSNAFGDYLTGGNHILPTGGLARAYSGLSTLDFVRWTTWQSVEPAAAAALAADTERFALAEGLPAHAAAAAAWRRP